MPPCPRCGQLLTDADCPACGMPTVTLGRLSPTADAPPPADLATLTRAGGAPLPAEDFRLAAGTLLADRYRVVAPLGRGGMGEVYRADDLHLGVPVALKFLPETLAHDPARLARLRTEVAAARQVSHPHVCRVYDIGEADGHSFLCMEFIPGDDLSGVLARAGRLAPDVACDLGRQIALGLHAVHDEGLVHRDLKPANVMVDGRGRAKLTDFGLAAAGASVTGLDAYAGTPAYQAPEQLAGGAITERTDVYALGAVVYELLTGRRPFTGSRAELVERQKSPPTKPSALAAGVGPEVNRVVLKCLAFDPTDRPASAHEVWRALPGDAALNMALAEGRTPSATAVADAGGEGRLSRRTALALAGWVALATLAVAVLNDWTNPLRLSPVRSPEELREAARSVLRQFGPADGVADTAGGFESDTDQKIWRDEHDRGEDRLAPLAAGRLTGVEYWYRENPIPLEPVTTRKMAFVDPSVPPFGLPGSARVWVDGVGRLLALDRVPAPGRPRAGGGPDWAPLFAAAGLDPADFRPTDPDWDWGVPYDSKVAWVGPYPGRPAIELRVEAAADRGEAVGFRLVAPWTRPYDLLGRQVRASGSPGMVVLWYLLPGLMLGVGVVLAAVHIRAGRADVRGAARFALGFGAVHLSLLLSNWPPVGTGELVVWQLVRVVGVMLQNVVGLAAGYLALEPFVRRMWPGRLIGWSRLLAGRVGDPRVGREVLIGVAGGALLVVVPTLPAVTPGWLGLTPDLPVVNLWASTKPGPLLLVVLLTAIDNILMVLFAAFVLAWLLRTRWLWVPGILALSVVAFSEAHPVNPVVTVVSTVVTVAVGLGVLLRVGLLAGIALFGTLLLLHSYPITYDFATWYWPATVIGLMAVSTVTAFGVVVSVGGWRSLVRPPSAG